jgi:hypothetical protein
MPNKQTLLVMENYGELLNSREDVIQLKNQIEESIALADVFLQALAEVEPIDWDFLLTTFGE